MVSQVHGGGEKGSSVRKALWKVESENPPPSSLSPGQSGGMGREGGRGAGGRGRVTGMHSLGACVGP